MTAITREIENALFREYWDDPVYDDVSWADYMKMKGWRFDNNKQTWVKE